MTAFGFQRAAIETADTPWQALDRALARWVLAHGGDETVAAAAAWTSYAERLGDTALLLHQDQSLRLGMAPLNPDQLARLATSPLVGDGSGITPFVLDADGRFFLWRNYVLEGAIAAHVRARLGAAMRQVDAVEHSLIDDLFDGDRSESVAAQRQALALSTQRHLFVLTGGPGTGKTSTILKMLLLIQRQASRAPSIALAAPTGKAAQRLLQSLRQGKLLLRTSLSEDWQPALAAIPDDQAATLHRLLAFDTERNIYGRGQEDPLAADIVVVDEASMVDLSMLHALLAALKPEASLILVGDADQLTSVAAGSVLQDLVQVLQRFHPHHVVRLLHSFRAAAHLNAINHAVRSGDANALRASVAAAGGRAVRFNCSDAPALHRLILRWAAELAAADNRCLAVSDKGESGATATRTSPQQALAALRLQGRRQLLCALREEDSGALAINRHIEERLRQLWQVPAEQRWYAGRAVMITRNDYAAGLYNGDIGLALKDEEGELRVWFEAQDEQGRISARAFAPASLPEHETAFAITIHKSQGSEYEHVAVVLPLNPEHRILSRQLLYTALSRAKQSIEIWGGEDAISTALARVAERHGGLAARLVG